MKRHGVRTGIWLVAAFSATMALEGCKDMGTQPSPPQAKTTTPPPAAGATVSFAQNVRPIFANPSVGCLGCHGGTNNLSVGTVADLLRGGLHGPAIVRGNSSESLLIQKVSATPPFGDRMPFGGKPLADSTIQVIRDWIDQGALDN
jgi:hypothetical protein